MKQKIGFIGIIQLVCAFLSMLLSTFILISQDNMNPASFLRWSVFLYVILMLLSNVMLSHRFSEGRLQEILFLLSSALLISNLLGYVLFCLILSNFNFQKLDWFGFLESIVEFNAVYYGIVVIMFIAFIAIYCYFIDRRMLLMIRAGLRGKGKLKQVETNLENSRWMKDEERDKIFKPHKYSKLAEVKKDGIPVMAKMIDRDRDMKVVYNSPCHSLVIGSTGSGKTTTFVNPMIQLIGATGAGSSMIMTDPKGELFALHSKYLVSRGYDVKVIDLRDTYASYRWNPLDMIWDNYQKFLNAHNEAFARRDKPEESGLQIMEPLENFKEDEKWYEFDGKGYASYARLVEAIKVYKKKVYDEVYEDLNDLVSVLIPVENPKDPMWEKGARSITLAVLLAMLEDSADERLGMTKEKFNFFNMTKILQNSSKDYLDLRNYFAGRSVLSKALSLSKQVCDAAEQTRASYMSIVYEKLTMFNDAGICALTSSSDFNSEQLAEKPTALFLKIPDEKDTRHNLAAIFILNIYKTLIKIASATVELALPRNVYFIMDEFGNMPKIEKFDKFITVGRSRKIWFTMIIQSYAQLNNVYGDTVADIVKGNCGIKMFIGSNDMNTCKEYSELCGNITVVTSSTSGSLNSTDINLSNQTQVRPLIYPSELQRLNKPGNIGNSIIVTFGNYPLKTYFSPSFKVPFYQLGKMDTSDLSERYFDENTILYSASARNEIVFEESNAKAAKEETITFTPGPGVEAMIHGQNDENKTDSTENGGVEAQEGGNEAVTETRDSEAEELLALWKSFKETNPEGTLVEFYATLTNTDQEG